MMNRRYALLGWAVWRLGKMMAKKRARSMVPGSGGHRISPALALPAVAVAVGGAYLFFRRGGGGGADGLE